MALERGTEEFEMFGDYFQFCKKYWNVKETDEYWEKFIEDGNVFVKKYIGFDFAKDLFWAFHKRQENICKERREKSG